MHDPVRIHRLSFSSTYKSSASIHESLTPVFCRLASSSLYIKMHSICAVNFVFLLLVTVGAILSRVSCCKFADLFFFMSSWFGPIIDILVAVSYIEVSGYAGLLLSWLGRFGGMWFPHCSSLLRGDQLPIFNPWKRKNCIDDFWLPHGECFLVEFFIRMFFLPVYIPSIFNIVCILVIKAYIFYPLRKQGLKHTRAFHILSKLASCCL